MSEQLIDTSQINQHSSSDFMGNGSIPKLMMRFALPCITALLVAALYNIVDQIFIGQGVGYLGNGATNVVYPITVFALGISILIGDGCAALMSISQGEGNHHRVHKCIGNTLTLSIIASAIMLGILLIFRDQLLQIFGATEANLSYAQDYYDIIILGLPLFVVGNALCSIVRADGSPNYAMIIIIIGAVINIVLDAIAIFVLEWGVAGAAMATVAGQLSTCILMICYLARTKSAKLSKGSFALDSTVVKRALPLGITSFLTQLSMVVILAVMNSVLITQGGLSIYGEDIPMTVMGIVLKIFQLVVAFIIGISVGCLPLVGYNYGAKNYSRVKQIYKYMIIIEIIVATIATILVECIPVQIISIFGAENELYNQFATYALRIYLSTMVLSAVLRSTSVFLQGLNMPIRSMSINLLRDFVLCTILVVLLGATIGVMGPLYAGPIADVIVLIMTIFIVRHVFKTTLRDPQPTLPTQPTA